jgi:hypothetical protein
MALNKNHSLNISNINLDSWNRISSSASMERTKSIYVKFMTLATALLIRPLIHTGLPRSFATTLTKYLASSAIMDSIDRDEHNATLNEDDVRDFIDAYLLEIKHHKHEKNTLFTGK